MSLERELRKITTDLAEAATEAARKAVAQKYRGTASKVSRSVEDKVAADRHSAEEILHATDRAGTAATGVHLLTAPSATRGRYRPSVAEQIVQHRQFAGPQEELARLPSSLNMVRLLRADDGSLNIYKPINGETVTAMGIMPARPGEQAKREVAAFRVDELLGFGRVPPTALIQHGPDGPGSLQQFVESSPALQYWEYPEEQIQQMAVLDKIISNVDRHQGNFRTSHDGSVVAIDHGLAFPKFEYDIHSPFLDQRQTAAERRHQLSEVISQVRAVDPHQLRAALEDLELCERAISGAIQRLTDIQAAGKIPYP